MPRKPKGDPAALRRELLEIEKQIAQHHLNAMHAQLEMTVRLLEIRTQVQKKLGAAEGEVVKHLKALVALKAAELDALRRGKESRKRRRTPNTRVDADA